MIKNLFRKNSGILFLCFILAGLSYACLGIKIINAIQRIGLGLFLRIALDWQMIRPIHLGAVIILIYLCCKLVIEKDIFEKYTDEIDAIGGKFIGLWIALAACLGLYLELMIIRLHSSYFQLFAYFKNISLLSCFLGLGIGYLRGVRRPLMLPLVLPLLTLQILTLYILRFSALSIFLQNPIKEQATFGIKAALPDETVIVYCFLIVFFLFNALCFIPLGQLASRLMLRKEKLVSYSWNLLGSLLGIAIFSFLSFIWMPPSLWIICAALMFAPFLYKNKDALLPSVASIVLILIVLALPARFNSFEFYSPYQILTLIFPKDEPTVLKTSNTYYQRMLDLRKANLRNKEALNKWSAYYEMPYSLKPAPEKVLIVGSGTGNDVAAALRNNANEVDAVEIDPLILEIGSQLHPEEPYQNNKVRIIIDDARAFTRYTKNKYDLIVYGLLDSHTLLAAKASGLRLDSYVYTVEAFKEARSKLKDDGIMCLTFGLLRLELGRKMFLMLEEAFDGEKPIAYQAGYDGGCVFLAGNNIKEYVRKNPPRLREITSVFDNDRIKVDKSTDDWPFFYMPLRKYPLSYAIIFLALFIATLIFIQRFTQGLNSGFSAPCFFLGAGFMLIETKAITEASLIYGSTWLVVSIVVAAILILAFLANLWVMEKKALRPNTAYSLLFISIVFGLAATFVKLNQVSLWIARLSTPLILTLPLFFSGFVFSYELKKSASLGEAIASNLLGAMLGGFLEYNSMYFGFKSLYLFTLLIYLFAFLSSKRMKPA